MPLKIWERKTEGAIDELIKAKVPESLELDYKESPSLENTDKRKNEISKDISAFANSAGGSIVYGVVEKNHEPQNIDTGVDPQTISREWLENVITSRIHPKIPDVVINPITLSSGNCIYLVYIPQSYTAHQAHDKRYYKRHNFKSEPMEDYEVRDVMNRTKWPILKPLFSLKQSISATRNLDVTIENRGPVRVTDFALKVTVPGATALEPKVQHFDHVIRSNVKEGYQDLMLRSPGLNLTPIFPGDSLTVTQRGTQLSFVLKCSPEQLKDEKLYWIIYADDAPPRSGEEDFYPFIA